MTPARGRPKTEECQIKRSGLPARARVIRRLTEIDTETLAVRPGADLSSLAGETPSVRKKILNPFPERMVLTRIPGIPPAVGSPHDLAYSLDQLRYCGRYLGGQLGAEAEVAADYGEDREPCGQAPEHPGKFHGVAEADAV